MMVVQTAAFGVFCEMGEVGGGRTSADEGADNHSCPVMMLSPLAFRKFFRQAGARRTAIHHGRNPQHGNQGHEHSLQWSARIWKKCAEPSYRFRRGNQQRNYPVYPAREQPG